MSSVILFLFVSSGAAEHLLRDNNVKEPECGFNLFCYINDSLLYVINKLFVMLTLDKKFTEISKIKLLFNMHDNLRVIGENNYKIYQDITNTSKVSYDNKTVKPLFNLTEAIAEYLFEQKRELLSKNRTEVNHIHHDNKDKILNNTSCSFETNETIVDSVEFLSNFLDKVDKLSFQDLIDSTKKLINESSDSGYLKQKTKHRVRKTIKTLNFKPWRPENSSDDSETRRIFKGKRTKIKRYPFAASFHMTEEFLCAGSIISKNMILSAASCLQIPYNYKSLQDNPNYLTVRIGSEYTNRMGDLVPVTDIIFHPAYDPVNLQNNLAIAKMKRPIIFQKRNKKIRRIEFDRETDTVSVGGGVVTMLGWGDKNKYDTNSYGDPISYAHLKVYSLQDCKEIYSPHYVNEMHICAGFKLVGTGACNRDVGGPGIVGSILVGVVSFGPPVCGTPNTPTVFTKLSYYTAWIDDVITKDQAEDAEPKALPPMLREREMLQVIVKELPMTTKHTTASTTTKEGSKKLQILKKLFKELIRTGTINVNELLFNNDRNAEITTVAVGIVEQPIATLKSNAELDTILREESGMMLQDYTGVHSSTKVQQEKQRIVYEEGFQVDESVEQPVDRTSRLLESDNYETQVINFNPDLDSEEGLSIEYILRAKQEKTRANTKEPLPPEVIQYDRDLRHVTKKKHKSKRHRSHNADKERRVKKADIATEIVPFELDENLNPLITTKPPPKVYVKAREDTKSVEETTIIKTYDTDESAGANIEFQIIDRPSVQERKKSLLDYVNL